MKQQLDPQLLQQKKKDRTNSQSQSMGLASSFRSQDMGGLSSEPAIPIGTDSITTMTDAPMQCKKESRAAKKERKAEEARRAVKSQEMQSEYDLAAGKISDDYSAQMAQAQADLAANPDDEFLQYHSRMLDYGSDANGDVGKMGRWASTASRKTFNSNQIAAKNMDRYQNAHYVRDAAQVLGSMDSEEMPDEAEVHGYLEDEFLLANGRHRGDGGMFEGAEGTEQEMSEAYRRSCDVYIEQAKDVVAFTDRHADVFQSDHFTIEKLAQAINLGPELNTKCQQITTGLRARMREPAYHSLDPVTKQRLFETRVQIEAIGTMRAYATEFNTNLTFRGGGGQIDMLKEVEHMERVTHIPFEQASIGAMESLVRKKMGTAEQPYLGEISVLGGT